jgi:hypothetical protein
MGERESGPEFLSVRRCVLLAVLAAVVGVALRLAKPLDPPDPAFLERVESWNRLASELLAGHHLERRK